MTTQEWIKEFNAIPSTKYSANGVTRYDTEQHTEFSGFQLFQIPIPFGFVHNNFHCGFNKLTSLYNAPIELTGYFCCEKNKLTTLDHLPKYIGGNLYCQKNSFQNLNGLKGVKIIGHISFPYKTEYQLNYWVRALYNTDLDALEYHYDNHTYGFLAKGLENYIMNELEEIIKVKRLKRDLNV